MKWSRLRALGEGGEVSCAVSVGVDVVDSLERDMRHGTGDIWWEVCGRDDSRVPGVVRRWKWQMKCRFV